MYKSELEPEQTQEVVQPIAANNIPTPSPAKRHRTIERVAAEKQLLLWQIEILMFVKFVGKLTTEVFGLDVAIKIKTQRKMTVPTGCTSGALDCISSLKMH